MGTKISVARHESLIRLTFEEPTGDGARVVRDKDLPVAQALMLAAAITGEVIALISEHVKASAAQPAAPAQALPSANGAPESQGTIGTPT